MTENSGNQGDVGDASDFGLQLRRYRESAKLSLAEFAQVMHYSPSYLSRIETGKRHASEEIAWECDRVLGAAGALGKLVTARRRADRGQDDRLGTMRLAGWPPAAERADLRADRVVAASGYGPEYDAKLADGDMWHAAGKMRMARQLYQAAFSLADQLPKAQAEAVIRMSRCWSDPGQQDREAIARIEAALGALAGDDSREAALLRLRLRAHQAKKLSLAVSQDTVHQWPALDQGAALARRTLAELPADAPDEARCEVLTECRWGLYESDSPAELASISARIEEVAARTGSAHFIGESLIALAVDQLRSGQLTSALATIWRHRMHAARAGSALARWQQCVLDTLLDLWRGNFGAAREWLFGEARAIVEASEAELEIAADTLGQTYLGQAFWLHREQGRMAELLSSPMLQRMQRHEFAPIWRAGLTLAWCEAGNWTDAADQLAAFADETSQFRDLPPSGWAVPTLVLFAEACSLLSAQPQCRGLASELAPAIDVRLAGHTGELALAGWPTVLVGPVARARALLAFVADDIATALDMLGHAERLARTSPPQMARLRADRARVLLSRPGRPDAGIAEEASGLLTGALAAAERLGMAQLAAEVSALRPG